jgi:hypothetical protein
MCVHNFRHRTSIKLLLTSMNYVEAFRCSLFRPPPPFLFYFFFFFLSDYKSFISCDILSLALSLSLSLSVHILFSISDMFVRVLIFMTNFFLHLSLLACLSCCCHTENCFKSERERELERENCVNFSLRYHKMFNYCSK